jgi:phage shock protein E
MDLSAILDTGRPPRDGGAVPEQHMNESSWIRLIMLGVALVLIALAVLNSRLRRIRLKKALAGGARVIDVRSAGEYAKGHYRGAVNIAHDRIGDRLKSVGPQDATVILYCASGARSGLAARTLRTKGYTRVINAGRYSAMPK